MKSGKDFLIFPLDVPSAEEATPYVETLSEYVAMFKVGLELFLRSGTTVFETIRSAGSAGIFLDLKLHDIPVTVSRAMNNIAKMGVDLTTVHCGESIDMLKAAVEGSQGRVGVLGVTVLTSVTSADLQSAGFQKNYVDDLRQLVIQRASMAKSAGCAGIVCSGLEAPLIKERLGKAFLAITPGIRPKWHGAADDQRRIITPADAVQNGADYLVIGRPIRDAADPRAAAEKIAMEIDEKLSQIR
jgi:orotidine-5'-phosphate decarboxylase